MYKGDTFAAGKRYTIAEKSYIIHTFPNGSDPEWLFQLD
jgi:hypothetical protein